MNSVKKYIKYLLVVFLFCMCFDVSASVKCSDGKPGDTINCIVNNAGHGGSIKNITLDDGLTFVSCDVCDDTTYTIEANKDATFKFKISDKITESKKLNASFAGETAVINVVVKSEEDEDSDNEESDETIYSVTLVPGNGKSNKTLTCSINSLNTTCNVTLDEIEDENFNGWGKEKNCTEGAKGNIKVNKNITYYACYKNTEESDDPVDTDSSDKTLLLKSLVITNGEDKINLGFSIRKFEYNITVPTSVTSLDVDAHAQSDDIEVLIKGNNQIDKDENVIKIVLTRDGKSNEYLINVKKTDEVLRPLLNSLIIGGYNIDFNSEKFVYNLTIDNGIKSLNIKTDPEENVDVVGNDNLKDGSKINVIIKNPDTNESTTYVINISQNNSNLIIYIAIGCIVLVILIILLIVVVKKGRKVNNKNNKEVKKEKKVLKGQVVNNKNNIPEVKPIVNQTTNSNVVAATDDSIETLDL